MGCTQNQYSLRVSDELGRGNAGAAKFSIEVILSISICIETLFWIFCLVFHHDISYSFTNDEEVAEIGSSVSVLAFLILLNSVQLVLTGVAVGAGWQGVVAIIIIGCCYVIGIPLGVLLAYVVHLSIRVLWGSLRTKNFFFDLPSTWIGMLFGV